MLEELGDGGSLLSVAVEALLQHVKQSVVAAVGEIDLMTEEKRIKSKKKKKRR